MKQLVIILAVGVLSYCGYRYLSEQQRAPTVVVVAPTPAVPRLAPEGTYFLLDYYGVHTDRGVIGWTPGQQVKVVSNKENEVGKLWVSDGQLQAQLDEAFLTRDIDLATRLSSTDIATQAAASRQALFARDQQMAAEKREQAEAAKADAQAGRQRTRTVYVSAPTPSNLLDRAAKPTNGGRQVSSAPDISNVRIIPQSTPIH